MRSDKKFDRGENKTMKHTNVKSFKMTAAVTAVALMLSFSPVSYANNLIYNGNQDENQQIPNTAPGQVALAPVGYSTNYNTQYHPYSSFMQSPYDQQQYGYGANYLQVGQNISYNAGNYGPQSPMQPGQQDPYLANEVSPYSKYSPYLEIVGEGSDYKLGIDDVVTVIVRNQPDFSGRFVVDPEGNVQYNFVGDIKAEGKTKEELKQVIVDRLREYVRYPEVAVMISDYRSKAIYVFGYVNRPGKYAMKGNKITVKEAVVAAGLPREDGALKRVYVIRPSEHREEGTAAQKKVDLKKLMQEGDSAEDFYLEPGDTIVVHQRYFDKFVNAFSRIVSPLFQAAAVYNLGWGQSEGFLA